MYKLVAIYRPPEDEATFDDHYFNVHARLMARVPGYTRIEVSKVTRHLFGEPQVYLMFEMWRSLPWTWSKPLSKEADHVRKHHRRTP